MYLLFHKFYMYIRHMFFRLFSSIVFVYHYSDDKIRNITWNYYLGYGLDKFKNGTFYAKVFKKSGTKHIAFDGHIDQISKIEIVDESEINIPKRKHIILSHNGEPLDVDLTILDNYRMNMEHFEGISVKNLGKILKLLGLKCSHVTILQHRPFYKKTIDVREVDIDVIYH
jgi:hypothetical protein